tara:strand:- start:2589 stop:2744 length:156 start_codon:yes stop_codon:yes gene_type:complete
MFTLARVRLLENPETRVANGNQPLMSLPRPKSVLDATPLRGAFATLVPAVD